MLRRLLRYTPRFTGVFFGAAEESLGAHALPNWRTAKHWGKCGCCNGRKRGIRVGTDKSKIPLSICEVQFGVSCFLLIEEQISSIAVIQFQRHDLFPCCAPIGMRFQQRDSAHPIRRIELTGACIAVIEQKRGTTPAQAQRKHLIPAASPAALGSQKIEIAAAVRCVEFSYPGASNIKKKARKLLPPKFPGTIMSQLFSRSR
jgi:hypothetical protein